MMPSSQGEDISLDDVRIGLGPQFVVAPCRGMNRMINCLRDTACDISDGAFMRRVTQHF